MGSAPAHLSSTPTVMVSHRCWLRLTFTDGTREYRLLGEGTAEHCERVERHVPRERVEIPLKNDDGVIVEDVIGPFRVRADKTLRHAETFIVEANIPVDELV
jgi:hypothetical protein